jgi:adenosylcobyric acid synthase
VAVDPFQIPGSDHEIHIEQAHQAIAAGLVPSVDMNPVLVKSVGDRFVFLVEGQISKHIEDIDLENRAERFRALSIQAFNRLAQQYDFIVVEGCGSPVELNIKDRDFVNFWVAEKTNSRCLMVADVAKGGVFASLIGTINLLSKAERKRIVGFVVNKFDGLAEHFEDGIRIIEERSGIPCVGVIPQLPGLEVIGREFLPYEPAPIGYSTKELGVPSHSSDMFFAEVDRWTKHVISNFKPAFLDDLLEQKPY